MPAYEYKALDARGKQKQGVLEADAPTPVAVWSDPAAAAKLKRASGVSVCFKISIASLSCLSFSRRWRNARSSPHAWKAISCSS